MLFKFILKEITIREDFTVSILREKVLLDDLNNTVHLSPVDANYRCTLCPNEHPELELQKIWADGAMVDPTFSHMIGTELRPILKILWTSDRIAAYHQGLQQSDP